MVWARGLQRMRRTRERRNAIRLSSFAQFTPGAGPAVEPICCLITRPIFRDVIGTLMPFHVSLVGRKNLSREIYRQIARAILDGRLRPGDRLSPSRELADALDVSRMTVNVAYEQLAGEGFVTSRQGAGTFV